MLSTAHTTNDRRWTSCPRVAVRVETTVSRQIALCWRSALTDRTRMGGRCAQSCRILIQSFIQPLHPIARLPFSFAHIPLDGRSALNDRARDKTPSASTTAWLGRGRTTSVRLVIVQGADCTSISPAAGRLASPPIQLIAQWTCRMYSSPRCGNQTAILQTSCFARRFGRRHQRAQVRLDLVHLVIRKR
jgi:hypothetical protein